MSAPRRVILTPEEVEAYALGVLTLQALADSHACHPRTVAMALRRAGYRPEHRLARPRQSRRPLPELDPAERAQRDSDIVRQHFLGQSYEEIGKRYDVTKQRVAEIVAGFRRRVGLDRVPGLMASPCVDCGSIVAARTLGGPQYCQSCWYKRGGGE